MSPMEPSSVLHVHLLLVCPWSLCFSDSFWVSSCVDLGSLPPSGQPSSQAGVEIREAMRLLESKGSSWEPHSGRASKALSLLVS